MDKESIITTIIKGVAILVASFTVFASAYNTESTPTITNVVEKTNKNYLVYDCFLTTEEEIIHKQIDIYDMLDNFINESLITLKEILIFINKYGIIINVIR